MLVIIDAIGGAFADYAGYMKMYFEYINNFDDAVEIIEPWKERYLSHCERDIRHSQLNLLGYLLLPVQRMPRYRLLST